MEFEITEELDDPETLSQVQEIAEDGPVKPFEVDHASRFVLGYMGDEIVSYASLKPSYPSKTPVSDYASEIFHIGVDSDLRGNGLGRETFERVLEEADDFGEQRDLDYIYMNVWSPTTDLYHEVKDQVIEQEGGFSDDAIIEMAEEQGHPVDELADTNPMNILADQYGFEHYNEDEFRNTTHIKER